MAEEGPFGPQSRSAPRGALASVWGTAPGEGHRLAAPLEVFWTLSGLCNLSCSFCMTSSGPSPKRASLDPSERAQILFELITHRPLKVYLTGGEPLLLPDFWSLTEGLLGAGIFVEVTTNGTPLTPEVCRRLKEIGVSSVQVSLNGSDEAINQVTMGSASFARIRMGIQNAILAGLPVHVRPTVMAENIRDLPDLIRLLAEWGVPAIDLREVTPLGRAAQGFEAHRPDLEALAEFEAFCRDFDHPGCRLDFKSWSLQFEAQNHPALCTLGSERPAMVLIDEGGNLAGCSATFYLGFENSVLEYGWLGAWKRLEVLKEFRNPEKLEGACQSCEILTTCQGGCRAAAARLTGNVRAPDPLCPRLEGAAESPSEDAEEAKLWAGVGAQEVSV